MARPRRARSGRRPFKRALDTGTESYFERLLAHVATHQATVNCGTALFDHTKGASPPTKCVVVEQAPSA
eukprot:scaffold14251_cov114-Isochrysis_galbana.AAC.1